MDAGGAGELGEAGDARLDLGGRDHHEVGELVDDGDDVGQPVGNLDVLRRERINAGEGALGVGGEERLGGGLLAGVEADDVADIDLREDLVALLHLAEQPLERGRHFLGLGDDRDQHVRQRIENLQLHDLRIHHDHAHVFRGRAVEDRADDGVDADGFAGAGGTRDEQVGHLGEVGDQRLAGDVLAQRDRQLGLGAAPVLALEDLAHADGRGVLVGHLDADGGLAGDGGEDAYRLRAHAEGDVLVEAGDLFDAHAGGGHDLVAGDDGADVDFAEGHLDAELAQDAEQVFGILAVLLLAVGGGGLDLFLEERERGELVILVIVARREDGGLGFLGFLGLDDVELEFLEGGTRRGGRGPALGHGLHRQGRGGGAGRGRRAFQPGYRGDSDGLDGLGRGHGLGQRLGRGLGFRHKDLFAGGPDGRGGDGWGGHGAFGDGRFLPPVALLLGEHGLVLAPRGKPSL